MKSTSVVIGNVEYDVRRKVYNFKFGTISTSLIRTNYEEIFGKIEIAVRFLVHG